MFPCFIQFPKKVPALLIGQVSPSKLIFIHPVERLPFVIELHFSGSLCPMSCIETIETFVFASRIDSARVGFRFSDCINAMSIVFRPFNCFLTYVLLLLNLFPNPALSSGANLTPLLFVVLVPSVLAVCMLPCLVQFSKKVSVLSSPMTIVTNLVTLECAICILV